MPFHPGSEHIALPGNAVPGSVEAAVTLVVASRGRRMSTARNHAHCRDDSTRQLVGVRPGAQIVDDLLDGDDGPAAGQRRRLLDAESAPQEDVAGPVGFLRVDED